LISCIVHLPRRTEMDERMAAVRVGVKEERVGGEGERGEEEEERGDEGTDEKEEEGVRSGL
jgi:hypothetical protein